LTLSPTNFEVEVFTKMHSFRWIWMIWFFMMKQPRILFLVGAEVEVDSPLPKATLRKEEIWWSVGAVAAGFVFRTK
jgi:hypothetical protein